MTYDEYTATLGRLAGTTKGDEFFASMIPSAIAYAENRIYREGNFLATVTRNASVSLTQGQRTFTLPANPHFVTVEQINVITPAGTTTPDSGTRNSLIPTRRDVLDWTWGDATTAALPRYMAEITDQIFVIGPWPDQAYTIEVVGTIRPTPLSSANETTFLSLYLPDLFLAASMVFITGYQQNFGSQSDDPQAAMSWEQQYEKLLASTELEEMRKKWMSPSRPPEAQAA